jgi:hypothetical protein
MASTTLTDLMFLRIPVRTRDFVPVTRLIVLTSALYAVLYFVFLLQVVREASFAHGFLRPELRPGPFTSDRFGFDWFAVLFGVFNLVPLLLYVWILYRVNTAITRLLHLAAAALAALLDFVAFLGVLLTVAFFCNNTLSEGSLCNDASGAYCLSELAPHVPERCPPLPGNATGLPLSALHVNPVYRALGIHLALFTLFNVLAVFINGQLASTVVRYNIRTQGRGFRRL